MAEIWFISDTHLFHENILFFKIEGGGRLRPEFDTLREMHEAIVRNWTKVISPADKVWHLGDVAMKAFEKGGELDELLGGLPGHKRLVLGNHDNPKSPVLQKHFEKIQLWKGFHDHGFTCSHIPLMLSSLRDGKVNVHGHIHERTMANPYYINVCVEVTGYAPVHIEDLAKRVKEIDG